MVTFAVLICCICVPVMATNTKECVSSIESGSKQVSFKDRLDLHISLPSDLPGFSLILHGDDDNSSRYFNMTKKEAGKYKVSTANSASEVAVSEGCTNWTLAVLRDRYKRDRLHLSYGNSLTLKPTLPANPDHCYLIQFDSDYEFDYSFCYPDSSKNYCSREPLTTTTTSATTTTTTTTTTSTRIPTTTKPTTTTTPQPVTTTTAATEEPKTSSPRVTSTTSTSTSRSTPEKTTNPPSSSTTQQSSDLPPQLNTNAVAATLYPRIISAVLPFLLVLLL